MLKKIMSSSVWSSALDLSGQDNDVEQQSGFRKFSRWATILSMQIGTNHSQLRLRVGGQRHCMQEQSKGLSLTKL